LRGVPGQPGGYIKLMVGVPGQPGGYIKLMVGVPGRKVVLRGINYEIRNLACARVKSCAHETRRQAHSKHKLYYRSHKYASNDALTCE
jgi:hypothetical protein